MHLTTIPKIICRLSKVKWRHSQIREGWNKLVILWQITPSRRIMRRTLRVQMWSTQMIFIQSWTMTQIFKCWSNKIKRFRWINGSWTSSSKTKNLYSMICNKVMARTICSKAASTVRKGRDLNWGSCLTTSNRQPWEKNPKYRKNWRSRILVLLLSKHHSRGLFIIKRWEIFEKKKKISSRAYCRQTAWTRIFSIYSLELETLKAKSKWATQAVKRKNPLSKNL